MNRVCPSCQAQVDASISTCAKCGYQFKSSGNTLLVQPAVRPKIPAEIVAAVDIDRTGSSLQFEQGIKLALPLLLKPIEAKASQLKVYLQTHGDLECGEQTVLLTNAGTVDQAIQDAQKIVYEGGGDLEETHIDAAVKLLKEIPWKADTRRSRGVIIMFLTGDSKKARSGQSAREIGEAIKNNNILCYLICEPTPTLKELCDAAGGLMFQITNNPDPIEMQRIASMVSASIIATVACGGTKPLTVPINAVNK
ncbi:MAG: hypothetical protein V1701_05300 [Planctomycetota bacterium]